MERTVVKRADELVEGDVYVFEVARFGLLSGRKGPVEWESDRVLHAEAFVDRYGDRLVRMMVERVGSKEPPMVFEVPPASEFRVVA